MPAICNYNNKNIHNIHCITNLIYCPEDIYVIFIDLSTIKIKLWNKILFAQFVHLWINVAIELFIIKNLLI